ncbi:MAG: hypothetical protein U0269_30860, partial [Polyangiales bacterium]
MSIRPKQQSKRRCTASKPRSEAFGIEDYLMELRSAADCPVAPGKMVGGPMDLEILGQVAEQVGLALANTDLFA